MVRAICNFGPGYKPPSYNALRTTLLQKAKLNVDSGLAVWRKDGEDGTGFVLSSDGWEDVTGKPLINIVFSTPKGSQFVEAVNATGEVVFTLASCTRLCHTDCLQALQPFTKVCSVLPGEVKDAQYMAGLWLVQIERIGPENVSAIIADGAAVNPAAARIVAEQ